MDGGKDTEVSTLGVLASDSCQLTMGTAVSAEHRGTDPPGARERVWLGGRCPHEVGGVASWREAFRSELLRADSDFPKVNKQKIFQTPDANS